jgi:hypothetical protein
MLLALFLLPAAIPAAEQAGVVKSKGLPIPGASVVARNGGMKAATSTDEAGRYAIRNLPAGAWTVEVDMPGFVPARQEVTLGPAPVSLEWSLKVAKSAGPAAARPTAARTVAQADAGAFQRVGVAAAPEGEAAAVPAEAPAPEAPRAAAAESDTNEAFLVNGSLGHGLQLPRQEDPMFQAAPRRVGATMAGNRAGRGPMGVQGGAFYTLRDASLDARPFSLNGQDTARPGYAQNYFGLVGGGPLHIPHVVHNDQTFFFASYIANRGRNPYSAASTLPTPAERSGDFAGQAPLYDLASRLPYPQNRIPAARLSPIATGLLAYMPPPSETSAVRNYQYRASVANNNDNLGLRLGRNLNKRDRLYAVFNLQRRSSQAAQLYGFRDYNSGLGYNLDTTWMHTFKSGTISSLKVTFGRNNIHTRPQFGNAGPPNLTFTNFGGMNDASPLSRHDTSLVVAESISRMKGRHTVSAGGGWRHYAINVVSDQNARGTLSFSGLLTSAFTADALPVNGTGMDFADFLLGLPQTSSIRSGGADVYYRSTVYNVFAQDDFRIRKNLTLLFGLRYEYLAPVTEKYGRMANLDVAHAFTGAAVVTPGAVGPYTGKFPDGLVDPDRNNFAPRLGITWKPWPKRTLQLRAGYGWYYNTGVYAAAAARMAQQPPFSKSIARNTTLLRILTFENAFVLPVATAGVGYISNTYAVDRHYRDGYAQTWNFAVQRDMPGAVVVELGYLGTKGTRLDMQRLPNRAAAGSPLTAEQRRMIANVAGFLYESSDGSSIYHAAQARLTRRLRKGVSANALYTFGKSIDNASTFGGGVVVVAQDDTNLRAERGLSSFDKRHNLAVSWVLTSPAADAASHHALPGWKGALLKDWTLSGGVTATSGVALTAMVMGNRSDVNGTGVMNGGRADATGAPVAASSGFFNPAAFTLPPAGRFGNAGRNTIPGPALFQANAAFGRAFRLNDQTRTIELRLNANNALNHVSITRVGTTLNSVNYTLAADAAAMRAVTLVLRFRF